MPLVTRIYFNAVFGALGGLLGWMLFGVFGDPGSVGPHAAPAHQVVEVSAGEQLDAGARVRLRLLLGGALIGGAIGYFVVSVDALRDRSLLRFVRQAAFGLVLGAVGGALGILIGDEVNFRLVGLLGAPRPGAFLPLLGTMLGRGVGWMFLGTAIGVSEGIAARSLGKLSYGALGGALGGFVGGGLFGLLYPLTPERGIHGALWGALGLVILGACIGALSALVQGVFQPASVRIIRGWQEGREYPLLNAENRLGRDEHADIALFRDMRVEKQHASIRREGPRYLLVNHQAPPDFTRVNGAPVANRRDLKDGDRIQLGNVVLRFQLRAAVARVAWRGPRGAGGKAE